MEKFRRDFNIQFSKSSKLMLTNRNSFCVTSILSAHNNMGREKSSDSEKQRYPLSYPSIHNGKVRLYWGNRIVNRIDLITSDIWPLSTQYRYMNALRNNILYTDQDKTNNDSANKDIDIGLTYFIFVFVWLTWAPLTLELHEYNCLH